MVAAGDAQTPLLAVRYGWNRQPNSTWGAVISPSQARFAGEALDIAYARWPWIGGMGWAAYRPDAPASDPIWGFSLNDATARALAEWRQTQPVRAAALAAHPPPQRDWPLAAAPGGDRLGKLAARRRRTAPALAALAAPT